MRCKYRFLNGNRCDLDACLAGFCVRHFYAEQQNGHIKVGFAKGLRE